MDKKIFNYIMREQGIIQVSEVFTGQVSIILNYNQGSITNIQRIVKDDVK